MFDKYWGMEKLSVMSVELFVFAFVYTSQILILKYLYLFLFEGLGERQRYLPTSALSQNTYNSWSWASLRPGLS